MAARPLPATPDSAYSSGKRWRWDDFFAYDLAHVAETIDLDPVVQSTYGMRLVPQPGGDVAVAMAFLQSVEDSQSSEHRDRILEYLRESPMFSHLVKSEDGASLRGSTLPRRLSDGSR